MTVEFVNLKSSYDLYAEEHERAAIRCLRSGWYILGNELSEFEKRFADFIGSKYCIGVGNGQEALILAFRALGIGVGDEVITQSNAYIASVLGITENGATPVFVEPNGYFTIDADKIEAAITSKTKAILAVHLYGQASDMERISAIAKAHGLYLIEDCAQCHGAQQNGRMMGTFGDISCFSFYPTKPIGALGDAGACVTNSAELENRLKMLRNYGSGKKYVNEILGTNSRMDELQAAMLQVSLDHTYDGIKRRGEIAARYLSGIDNPLVTLPKAAPNMNHVWHIFALMTVKRDELQNHLLLCGIKTAVHYPIPPHLQQCYAYLGHKAGDFPIAERYANEELSLPIYNGMTDEDVDSVINAVNCFEG